MEKAKIITVGNYGNVHRYVIAKQKDIHGLFCNLFSKLKFSEDSIGEVDIIFDNLDNEYIYINEPKNDIEMHIFVTREYINLIIKTGMEQKKLNEILKEFFEFVG